MRSSEALSIIIPFQKLPVPSGSPCKSYECNNIQGDKIDGLGLRVFQTLVVGSAKIGDSKVRVTKFDNLTRKL